VHSGCGGDVAGVRWMLQKGDGISRSAPFLRALCRRRALNQFQAVNAQQVQQVNANWDAVSKDIAAQNYDNAVRALGRDGSGPTAGPNE